MTRVWGRVVGAAPLSSCAAVLCLSLAFGGTAGATTKEIWEGDSFEQAVEGLVPGDTLIVHEGTYADSGRIAMTVKGTPDAPVLVRGADGEARPHITRLPGGRAQNTINIDGATHLTIRGLEISSQPGGDGVNLNSQPSYITLEDLEIHDVSVGVNFRSDMHHITVRRVHIYDTRDTGEGMYVGCHDGSCAVTDSLIEENWIHDTMNSEQGDGIEVKRGSGRNIIRNNVIYNTRYPGIILYGTDGRGRNIVEGNVIWNNLDSGIQVAADAVIRNNIIIPGPGAGLNSQSHAGVTPNNLEIVHNTIIGGSPCLRLYDWSGKEGMVLANNAIYCDSDDFRVAGLSGVAVDGNVVLPATSSLPSSGYEVGRSLELDFLGAADRNLYPTADSALIDAGTPTHVTPVDFNGTPRAGVPDAGAYTWTAPDNPGWLPGPGFKGAPSGPVLPSPPENVRVVPE